MVKNTYISDQPYKGARDFYPADMALENYIFNTWKKVCKLYGFQEYSFPIIEPYETFAAKTGEEIVNTQLFSFEDRGGRKLAVRPELTPGTVRMISQKYKELPQPIKWFMIGNNWRFEKPQMGRGREFYQLEANIFGVPGPEADLEIFLLVTSIMKEFGATEEMFGIQVSDRRLIAALLKDVLDLPEEIQIKTRRLMDKWKKMEQSEFEKALLELGLTQDSINKICAFMSSDLNTLAKVVPAEILENNEGYKNITALWKLLENAGIDRFCRFEPSIIRGFDYSDGLVYEVFDKNPVNKRSLFGGERFDRLINIFGEYELPATGFAMGDYTLGEFLKGWKLIPTLGSGIEYFVTVWPSESADFLAQSVKVAEELRKKQKNTQMWLDPTSKLDKQLKYADKAGARYALIIGESELGSGNITVKNMAEQKQVTMPLEKFLDNIE